MIPTKVCNTCNIEKPLTEYHKHPERKDGRYSKCKDCTNKTKTRVGVRRDEHPLYTIYLGIRERCYSKTCKDYKNYGAKGITLCEEWYNDFYSFAEYMGERPSLKHSIDRIDFKKGYEPGNCRWATPIEQQRNKCNNRLLTYNGETKCVSEWGHLLGDRPHLVFLRLNKGWSIEKALTTPVMNKAERAKEIDKITLEMYFGNYTYKEIAEAVGIKPESMGNVITRLRKRGLLPKEYRKV